MKALSGRFGSGSSCSKPLELPLASSQTQSRQHQWKPEREQREQHWGGEKAKQQEQKLQTATTSQENKLLSIFILRNSGQQKNTKVQCQQASFFIAFHLLGSSSLLSVCMMQSDDDWGKNRSLQNAIEIKRLECVKTNVNIAASAREWGRIIIMLMVLWSSKASLYQFVSEYSTN